MATLSAAGPANRTRRRRQIWLFAAGLVVALAAVGFSFISANWPYRYRKIKPMLEDDLASQIEVTSYHRIYFPRPGFVAMGLTLRRKTALNLPPMGHAVMMEVEGRWSDLLLLRRRVQDVEVTGLHIVIPPVGSQANHANFPPGSSSDFTGPDTAIEMFKIHNSILEIMENDGKRLIFPIRELDLANFVKNKAMNYSLDMQNAIPSGRIQSRGTFGPLNAKQIGITPVTGNFTFTSVNLHDVGDNIAGTMASKGAFRGPLAALEAQADTLTPNFSVNGGTPTRVEGSVQCSVNGTNGEVGFHQIEAHTGATTILAMGSVRGSPGVTNLDIEVKGGRAEDVMRPFIRGEVPITGPVWLRSHAYLAPAGQGRFLHRLHVSGAFNVPAERITDSKTEKNLTDFSHRAENKKDSDDGSRAATDAISSLKGPARIEDGIASSTHLAFRVPGAQADLGGTFNFHTKAAHLVGSLRMDTDISHTATGFKSFLLKPLAPFFRKKNAGALVPIAVTGGPGHYQVTQDFGHKK